MLFEEKIDNYLEVITDSIVFVNYLYLSYSDELLSFEYNFDTEEYELIENWNLKEFLKNRLEKV